MSSGFRHLKITIIVPYNDNAEYVEDHRKLDLTTHIKNDVTYMLSERTNNVFDLDETEISLENR